MKTPFILMFMIILTLGCISQNNQTIKIGGVFALTGPGSQWGLGEYDAVKLIIDEINDEGGINGEKIELIVEDTKTDFTETVTVLQKLIQVDNIDIIIGPTWFGQVASPVAEENKVVMISPSAGVVTQPSYYFFDVWPTEKQEVRPVISDMVKNNISRIVIIYSQNDWSQSMRDNFITEAENYGIEIVSDIATDPFEKDFRTVIIRLKTMKFDALYIPFAFYPAQGEFLKQLTELNVNTTIYSSSGTENLDLLENYGPYLENVIYPYPDRSELEEGFRKKFQQKYGYEPASPSASYAYDAALLVISALKDGKQKSEDIVTFFQDIKDFRGVSNIIEFDNNGRIKEKPFIMKIVKSNNFETVK